MICPMPFIHLNIKPDEAVTACWRCHAVLGKYNEESLSDIWNGQKWQEFRQQHLDGKRPEGCKSCWEMEDAGVESTRQVMLRETAASGMQLSDVYSLTPPAPQDIEIRFGNLCNLQCRHCSQKFSSQWMNTIKANPELQNTMREIDGLPKTLSVNELPDNTADELREMAPNLRMIRITGGEPLMHPMHYDMLDAFSGYEQNIVLDYNSNLHYLGMKGKKISDYWKKFKNVTCRVSIDADESNYNYIRYKGNIDKLKYNWSILQSELKEEIERSTFNLYATCTVSVLNAVRIKEVYKLFQELGSKFHISFVQYPRVLDICELPQNIKDNIKSQCQEIIDNGADDYDIRSMKKIIKWLDKKPNLNNFDEQFVTWMKAQDKINGDCLFDYYTEFDYLKEKYYETKTTS